MSQVGVKVYHYHRTVSEYIAAFTSAEFLLRSLAEPEPEPKDGEKRSARWRKFPFQIATEFIKVK
jgi:hypothetical protein